MSCSRLASRHQNSRTHQRRLRHLMGPATSPLCRWIRTVRKAQHKQGPGVQTPGPKLNATLWPREIYPQTLQLVVNTFLVLLEQTLVKIVAPIKVGTIEHRWMLHARIDKLLHESCNNSVKHCCPDNR